MKQLLKIVLSEEEGSKRGRECQRESEETESSDSESTLTHYKNEIPSCSL